MTHTHDSETELAQLRQRIAALEAENARYQQVLGDLSQLRLAVEHAANSIVITDTEARILHVNQAFTAQTGYTAAEVIGKNPRILQSGTISPDYYETMWATLTAGRIWRGEFHSRRKDGTLYWESAVIAPIRNEQGTISAYVAIKEDITDARQTLVAVQQSEANHRQIVELSPDAIIVHRDSKILFVNAAAVTLLRAQDATDLIGRPVLDLVPSRAQVMARARIDLVAQGHVAEPLEQQIVCLDGVEVDVSVLGAPVTFDGQPANLAIIRDITTRKETERRLAAERRFNRAVLDTVGAIVVVMDRNGRIARFNRAAEAITGYSEADMIGTFVWDRLLLPEEVDGVKAVFKSINETGMPSRSENYWVAKDGSRRLIAWSNTVLRDAEGAIEHLIGTGVDITERTETERQLLERNQMLHRAQQIGNMGHWTWDLTSDVIILSDTAVEIFGFMPYEEGTLLTIQEIISRIHPDDLPHYLVAIQRARDIGTSVPVEVRILLHDGTLKDVVIIGETVPAVDGRPERRIGIVQDITQRKEAERKLQTSEQRLSLALRGADHALWDWNLETGEVVRSDLWATMLGYMPDEIERMITAWERLVHPDDMIVTLMAIEAHIRGDVPLYEVEYRLLAKDGRWVWVQDRGRVVERTADGTPRRITGMHHDITARKESEQQLRQSEARHRAMLQAVPDLIVRMNRDGVYLELIPGEGVQLIWPAEEQIGRHVTDIMPPQLAQQVLARVRRTLDTGEMQQTEYTLEIESAPRHFVARSVVYGPDEVLTVIHDVTARKMAEQRALELAIERQRVDVLTNFIAEASHEFRTPLSVIGLNTYLLERVSDREKHAHYLSEISSQIAHLVKLVDGLLIMAQLDSKVAPQRRPIDARQTASWVTSNYQEIANGFGVALVCTCTEALPLLRGDPDLIMQALGKVLDNALRYTPAGGTVTVSTEATATHVVFAVTDTGLGLSDVEQERIFERFYRGDEAHSTRGFGLGLPIAQAIVELHGGRIEVKSVKGEGSTFRLLFPLPQDDAGA